MATKALATYDPGKVVVTIGPSFAVVDGFADGTFVNITTPDLYESTAGVNAVARVKKTDRRCQITLTLLQTSNANLTLSGIRTLDVGGNGVGPCIIKDGSGNSLFMALTTWIRKGPDVTYGTEIENREWVLESDDFEVIDGGN